MVYLRQDYSWYYFLVDFLRSLYLWSYSWSITSKPQKWSAIRTCSMWEPYMEVILGSMLTHQRYRKARLQRTKSFSTLPDTHFTIIRSFSTRKVACRLAASTMVQPYFMHCKKHLTNTFARYAILAITYLMLLGLCLGRQWQLWPSAQWEWPAGQCESKWPSVSSSSHSTEQPYWGERRQLWGRLTKMIYSYTLMLSTACTDYQIYRHISRKIEESYMHRLTY